MRYGVWGVVAGALALGGCFGVSVPLLDSGAPHLTNPAVEACKKKAAELYDDVGEHQATPTGEGRYTVVLDVREKIGFALKTCHYDPATGAAMQAPPSPAAAAATPETTPPPADAASGAAAAPPVPAAPPAAATPAAAPAPASPAKP
jgi:hypothetical protein